MICAIENHMVVGMAWPEQTQTVIDEDLEKKLNNAGYEEIGTGIFVPEEDAYDYALERLSLDKDLQKEFVEWFFSGNWVREDGQ